MIRFYKTIPREFPSSVLPQNAKVLNEAKTPLEAIRNSNKYLLVSMGMALLAIVAFRIYRKYVPVLDIFACFGILLAFLCIPLHEFLHAILFPIKSNTIICISWKERMAFTWSDAGVRKCKFLIISAFPSLILGIVPLCLWVCLPTSLFQSNCASFGTISLIFCCGDFLNIYNIFKQVPRGAYVQLSGMNSYWYFKNNCQKTE